MKTLSLLIVLFAVSFSKAPVEKSFLPASESLIDMIGRAEFIPVYFVTKEVFYNNIVTKKVTKQGSAYPSNETFMTCKGISESAPLPESYNSTYNKVVSELNRVFKTTKFVLKESSDIPLTEKQGGGLLGLLAGWTANKIQPPLKGFDFSGISAPFFVFCSIGAFYESDDLLKIKGASKNAYKEYEAAGVRVLDQITVSLDGFLNVRFLNYDSKKKDVKYTDPTIFSFDTKGESFIQSECYSSINDFVTKVSPASGAPLLESKITGMFDDFANRKWKKQK